MLGDNIRIYRKQKEMSQEELANKLNVVRQTVSKWEQNLSVPDSEMLIKIADVFEVSTGSLLGETAEIKDEKTELAEISQNLENLNKLLTEKNTKTRKTILRIILIGLIIIGILILISTAIFLSRVWFIFSPSTSVGIIGGADGPTSVLISSDGNIWAEIIVSVLLSIGIICTSVYLFKKSKK